MVDTDTLHNIGLFEGLSKEQYSRIADVAEEVHHSRGTLIFQEGERAEHVYVMLEGKAAIRIHLTSRPESLTVSVINKPYQSLGWSGIVSPNYFTASAVCETDCRLLAIPGDALMEILKQDPEAAFLVMCRISELISDRLRSSRQVLLKSL